MQVRVPILINIDDYMDENVVHNYNNTLDAFDSEYEYVDVDNHLTVEFSKSLILAPKNEQSDLAHEHSPCLDLVIAPSIVLNVFPLAFPLPSQNSDQQ